MKFNSALWFFTTGLQFIVGWWYRKAAVFYLPNEWLGPLTWWIALPFAPKGMSNAASRQTRLMCFVFVLKLGSVSCGVWQMACRRVIKLGERLAKDILGTCWNFRLPTTSTILARRLTTRLVQFLPILSRSQ
jgi:tail-anchored protein insertion receptor